MDDVTVTTQHFDNHLHGSIDQAQSSSTSRDAQQPLQYDSISQGGSIRVLDLAPGTWDEPVSCYLRTVHLDDDNPHYEAISYAWGDPNDRKPVTCNGCAVTTTRSLFEALQRFRYVDTTRTLWADALCINQADDDEKTLQVRLMSFIYTKADRVLVWLQHDDDQVVQDSLNAICRFVCEEDGFGTFGGLDELPQPTPDILYRWRDVDVTSVRQVDSSEVADVVVEALERICSLPWFGRGWVVQEVALSTSASVFWGHGEIGFEWLGIACNCVALEYAHKTGLGTITCLCLFRVCGESRQSNRPRQSFLRLLFLTRDLAFSEPKDRIYGLLGLETLECDLANRQPFIDPDYDTTTMECYRRVAAKLLSKHHDFRVLSWIRYGSQSSIDWPSWVPDWKEGNFNAFTDFSDENNQQKDTSGLIQLSETISGRTRCIEISGFRVDTINWENKEFAALPHYEHDLSRFAERLQVLLRNLEYIYSQQCLACTFGNWRKDQPLDSVRIKNLRRDYNAFMERDFVQDIYSDRAAISSYVPQMDSMDSFVPNADQFAFKSCNQNDGRSLFITSTEMLGLGPRDAIPGDVVVVLHGSTIPFVLRPANNGLWTLVGECYVYEVNEGRAHREWKERGSVSEKFTIC